MPLPAASALESSACTLLAPPPRPRPPASPPACRRSFYAASLSTRQSASAFNQPLSWDMSGVTTMHSMFAVRSARAPASSLHSFGSTACNLLAPPPPPRPPASRPACRPSFYAFPFDSAGSVGVQPAAELGHVQRQRHELHVSRALRACPCQQPSQLGPLPAPCLRRRRPHAHPPPLPPVAPLFMLLPFRLGRPRRRSTSR